MSGNSFSIPLVHNAVGIMTPFLLAAIGGLYTELAGMLNIALEGLMIFSAFFSIVVTVATGNLLLGILGGVAATLMLTALFGSSALGLRANIFICGLATNLLASALSIVLSLSFYGQTGSVSFPDMPVLKPIRMPFLERIPVLGDIVADHNILVYVSWLLLVVSIVVIYRTPFGMRLRAAKDERDEGGALAGVPSDTAVARPALGVRTRRAPDGAALVNVFDGGAAQRAGLSAGDLIVAVGGIRTSAENLQQLLSRVPEGECVSVHAFRRDELLAFEVRPEPAPADTCELWLLPTAELSAAQLGRRDRWLGGG